MNVKETSELLTAVARLIRDTLQANQDGVITKMEALKIALRNAGEVVDAFVGISEIPGEMKDIDQSEIDELYNVFVVNMSWTDHHFAKNLFDAVFVWVRVTTTVTIDTIALFRNLLHPPKAEVVPELELEPVYKVS